MTCIRDFYKSSITIIAGLEFVNLKPPIGTLPCHVVVGENWQDKPHLQSGKLLI